MCIDFLKTYDELKIIDILWNLVWNNLTVTAVHVVGVIRVMMVKPVLQLVRRVRQMMRRHPASEPFEFSLRMVLLVVIGAAPHHTPHVFGGYAHERGIARVRVYFRKYSDTFGYTIRESLEKNGSRLFVTVQHLMGVIISTIFSMRLKRDIHVHRIRRNRSAPPTVNHRRANNHWYSARRSVNSKINWNERVRGCMCGSRVIWSR